MLLKADTLISMVFLVGSGACSKQDLVALLHTAEYSLSLLQLERRVTPGQRRSAVLQYQLPFQCCW